MLPYVMEFNLIASYEKLARIARMMEEGPKDMYLMEAAKESIEAVKRLSIDVGMRWRLRDIGINERDIPEMTDTIVKEWGETLQEKVSRQVCRQDIADIFKAAF